MKRVISRMKDNFSNYISKTKQEEVPAHSQDRYHVLHHEEMQSATEK